MNKTRKLLGEDGAVGEAFYIATPICCPSRTETLSGRVYHNVLQDNLRGCMSVNSTGYIFQHSSSLFPALQSAGYITGGFGKIINGRWLQLLPLLLLLLAACCLHSCFSAICGYYPPPPPLYFLMMQILLQVKGVCLEEGRPLQMDGIGFLFH